MNDYPQQPAGTRAAPDTELTPAELLRLAAAGRREYARTAPEQDHDALIAEALGYE